MTPIPRWSVTLATAGSRHPRWLTEEGSFTSDPARALCVSCPEVAASRLQAFGELHGWPIEMMERFRLVQAPPLRAQRRERFTPELAA